MKDNSLMKFILFLHLVIGEYTSGSDGTIKSKPSTIENIESILKELENPNLSAVSEMLKTDIEKAKNIMSSLGQKGRIHALKIREDDLRKIRQFRNPKKEVQDILVGFSLLLGEYEGFTRVCLNV